MTDKYGCAGDLFEHGEARRIARAVVEARLAACVNILPGSGDFHLSLEGESGIREGTAAADQNVAKTPGEAAAAVERLHSYDVPEFIALPIAAGSRAYLRGSMSLSGVNCLCEVAMRYIRKRARLTRCQGLRSDLAQRLIQVGDQILHVFDSDRDADQSVGDSDPLAHFGGNRGMRHRRRMRNQRFHSAQAFRQRAELHVIENGARIFQRDDVERNHGAESALLAHGHVVLRMRGQVRDRARASRGDDPRGSARRSGRWRRAASCARPAS